MIKDRKMKTMGTKDGLTQRKQSFTNAYVDNLKGNYKPRKTLEIKKEDERQDYRRH